MGSHKHQCVHLFKCKYEALVLMFCLIFSQISVICHIPKFFKIYIDENFSFSWDPWNIIKNNNYEKIVSEQVWWKRTQSVSSFDHHMTYIWWRWLINLDGNLITNYFYFVFIWGQSYFLPHY